MDRDSVLTLEEIERGADAELVHAIVFLMLLYVDEEEASNRVMDLLEVAGGIGDEMRKDFIREAFDQREDEPNEIEGMTKDDYLQHFEMQCVRKENYSCNVIVDCLSVLSAKMAEKDRENNRTTLRL